MTINITTDLGEFKVIAPIAISKSLKKKLTQSLRSALADEESKPIKGLLEKLRDEDPVIGTPQGALLAYKNARGWTQREISKKTGISQADISKILNGKRTIGLQVAKKFGKAFGVDYGKFL